MVNQQSRRSAFVKTIHPRRLEKRRGIKPHARIKSVMPLQAAAAPTALR